jgi:fructose-1,6-bisphosphatase I / sedoheptulose-1,7-bisphosphatase
VFGSTEEVTRIESYHQADQDSPQDTYQSPLFGKRGLFETME